MERRARSSFIFVICQWKSNLLKSKAFLPSGIFLTFWEWKMHFSDRIIICSAHDCCDLGCSSPASRKLALYGLSVFFSPELALLSLLYMRAREEPGVENGFVEFACEHEHRARTLCIKVFQRFRSLDVSNRFAFQAHYLLLQFKDCPF